MFDTIFNFFSSLWFYTTLIIYSLGLIAFVLITLLVVFAIFISKRTKVYREFQVHESSTKNVILITGCDHGIGKTTALHLCKKGFHIYATCFEDGAEKLKEEAATLDGDITTFQCDITKDESVQQLYDDVYESLNTNKQKLVGLLNNAGIARYGPIEVQPIEQFIYQIDVNTFGHVRVAQAFIPLLRESKGRIVNLVSLAGRVTTNGMGAYSCSKHGMEAVTDALRLELLNFGVSVSAIEPGFITTPLVENVAADWDAIWDSLNDNAREIYKDDYEAGKKFSKHTFEKSIDPIYVAKAIDHAFTSARPKTRYLVGHDAYVTAFLKGIVPDRVFDAFSIFAKELRTSKTV